MRGTNVFGFAEICRRIGQGFYAYRWSDEVVMLRMYQMCDGVSLKGGLKGRVILQIDMELWTYSNWRGRRFEE